MSHESTSPSVGQNPATDPTLVDVLEKNVRALVRMSAALLRLAERLTVVEGALADEGEDEPEEEPEEEPEGDAVHEPVTSRNPDPTGYVVPPLALLSDGRALLHVSELEGASLVTFERWEGVILSESETADVMEHLSHGFSEAAGMVGGWLLKRTAKKSEEGGES